jgi:tRNA(Ile)-lysidine synthase
VLSAVEKTIRAHALTAPGDRVLVAVSGGPDSTALLHGLLALAPRLRVQIEAVTIDHGLRPEAAAEAAGVASMCRALGVPCEVIRVDVRAARGKHVSWQDAARRVRLAALETAADRRGCARVALGHTADDQAETVLFRIVRGTGLRGLAGMPYTRGRLIRPLLDVPRAEVLRFLARRRLPFVDDPSNGDRRYARSRVRHDWLPLLARDNPRVVEALLTLAGEARAGVAADAGGLSRRAATTVARLAAEGAGTHEVSVRGGVVEVSYGRVSFRPGARGPAVVAPDPVSIGAPGVYRLGEGTAALDVREGDGPLPSEGAIFDLAHIARPLWLRAPRPGDRMRPRGGRGSRKLADLLIDAKVPRPRRALLPVLASADGTVLFVPGLRPAEAGRPGHDTREWLQVRAVSDGC